MSGDDTYIRVRAADGPRPDGSILVYLPDGTGLVVNSSQLLHLPEGATQVHATSDSVSHPPEEPMTPTGDHAFLHELDLHVRTELTLSETSQGWEEAVSAPIDEWLSDPADDQRYEASLRSLLGAVEALEDGPGPEPEGW